MDPVAHDRPQRQQGERQGDGLRDGLELAHPRGGDDVIARHHQPVHGDADLAHKHDDRHPPGQLAEDREPDERTAGQRLVGDRVEELSEIGDDLVLAGEVAVDAVGRDRDDEQDRRPPAQRSVLIAVGEQHPQEDRRAQDAHDRDRVRELPGDRHEPSLLVAPGEPPGILG